MKIASNPISIDNLEEDISQQVIIINGFNIFYSIDVLYLSNQLQIGC